jgi:hypothetical protein
MPDFAYAPGRRKAHCLVQVSGGEAGVDARGHVVSGHLADEGRKNPGEGEGAAGTMRFDEKERLEAIGDPSDPQEILSRKVMQDEVGDEDAAAERLGEGKEITFEPVDLPCQIGRARREIAAGRGAQAGESSQQMSFAGAEFDDALASRLPPSRDLAVKPSFIPHQEIDETQITPRSHRTGIVRIE